MKSFEKCFLIMVFLGSGSLLLAQELTEMTGYIYKADYADSGMIIEDSLYDIAYPLLWDEFDYMMDSELSQSIGQELTLRGEILGTDFYVWEIVDLEEVAESQEVPEPWELVGVWNYFSQDPYEEYPVYLGSMSFTPDDRWIFEDFLTGEITEGTWYTDQWGNLVTEKEEHMSLFGWGYHEDSGFYLELKAYFQGDSELDVSGSPILLLKPSEE